MSIKERAMLLIVFWAVLFGLSAAANNPLNAQDGQPSGSEEAAEESEQIMFYLYPKYSKWQTLKDYETLRLKYSNGLADVDISDTIWVKSETLSSMDLTFEVEGTPVTLSEFKKTWNYKNKRLLHVDMGLAHTPPELALEFDGWTLYDVDFGFRTDFSQCSFENALLLNCHLHKVGRLESVSGKNATIKTDRGVTYEQFSKTWNYTHNNFEWTELDLTECYDWDFTGMNVSELVLSRADLRRHDGENTFKNVTYSDVIGKKVGDIFENDRKLFRVLRASCPPITESRVLYESKNYQSKDCRFMRFVCEDDVDLSGQNLEFSAVSGKGRKTFKGATVVNAVIADHSSRELAETKSYQERDLCGCDLRGNFSGFDFSRQNLTGSTLAGSLKDADFTDAVISFCDFRAAEDLTPEQLKETWNFKTGNLKGIITPWKDWNLKYFQ
ncbi:MAG: pentapeptide repeat-containing protein [Thermoguttaceae bacterium]